MEKIKQDILLFFKDLTFDEASHSYTANGKTLTYSVSGLIKKLTIPFDAQAVSAAMARNSDLSQDEILQSLQEYKDRIIPLIAVIKLINLYVKRFDVAYLKSQKFLNPYPSELALRSEIKAYK